MAKAVKPKPTEAKQVTDFIGKLDHPLIEVINAVRKIILGTDSRLYERIKWAAPSYYFRDIDLVTFHLRSQKKVMLVFHNIAIVSVISPLLEGTYKDRRLMYFDDMAGVKKNKKELERIMQAYLALVDTGSGKIFSDPHIE